MCASYEAKFNVRQLVDLFSKAGVPLALGGGLPNLPSLDEVRPTDAAPAVTAIGGKTDLKTLKFGFPPPRRGARPVVNMRGEGRAFDNRDRSGRCLVPVSGFYEFTGDRYPKTRWVFRDPTLPFLALAGIWRAGDGLEPQSFSLLTTEPGPDVAPYHDRGVVPVPMARWSDWLTAETFPADIVVPAPEGMLAVSPAPRPPKDDPRLPLVDTD